MAAMRNIDRVLCEKYIEKKIVKWKLKGSFFWKVGFRKAWHDKWERNNDENYGQPGEKEAHTTKRGQQKWRPQGRKDFSTSIDLEEYEHEWSVANQGKNQWEVRVER